MQKIIEFLCYLTEKNDLNKEYLLKKEYVIFELTNQKVLMKQKLKICMVHWAYYNI